MKSGRHKEKVATTVKRDIPKVSPYCNIIELFRVLGMYTAMILLEKHSERSSGFVFSSCNILFERLVTSHHDTRLIFETRVTRLKSTSSSVSVA